MSAPVVPVNFPQGLGKLQGNLPLWWRSRDPTSQLYALLVMLGIELDNLGAGFDAIYNSRSLLTADQVDLLAQYAFLYGCANEQLPPTITALRAYLQAVAAADGSTQALVAVLMALLGISPLSLPANTTGGLVATFPASPINLVLNPSFEADAINSDPATWSRYNPQAQVFSGYGTSATWASVGAHACHVSATPATASFMGMKTTVSIPVVAGQSYSLSAAVNGQVLPAGTGALVQIQWQNAGGGVLSASTGPTVGTGVQRTSVSGVAPVGATQAALLMQVFNSSGGTTTIDAYFDAIQFTQSAAALGYIDGDQAGCGWQNGGGANPPTIGTPSNAQSAPGLVFAADGTGLQLFQFALGNQPSAGLTFPPDGSGLLFPIFPGVLGQSGVGVTTVSDGIAPLGAGPGLVFALNGYVSVIENPQQYKVTVQVKSWLTFDRAAFARAIERLRMQHCLATVIQEVP